MFRAWSMSISCSLLLNECPCPTLPPPSPHWTCEIWRCTNRPQTPAPHSVYVWRQITGCHYCDDSVLVNKAVVYFQDKGLWESRLLEWLYMVDLLLGCCHMDLANAPSSVMLKILRTLLLFRCSRTCYWRVWWTQLW